MTIINAAASLVFLSGATAELSAWTICTFSRELSHADGPPYP
jgi:hypothetical protein